MGQGKKPGTAKKRGPKPKGPSDEGTKQKLIAATARHLAEYGPRGTEVGAVCKELDLSPSLVNYYFDGPDQLIWQAALHDYAEHIEMQRKALERAPDGKLAIETWVLNTIEWKQAKPGIAAVVDYPMLALSREDLDEAEALSKELSSLSRENVTITGSAVYSLMTGKAPKKLSAARVAALIKLNSEFAYWISSVGFGGTGAAMWIAGRKPYSAVWRAFGFSPDKQIRSTLRELTARIAKADGESLAEDDEQ
jgi:AcrR family transcriptional regulator